MEFLTKVDRKGTLKGWLGPDYVEMCQKHPEYVLSELRQCFRSHERRHGDGDYKLGDPVGWLGKHAARVGKIRWHGKM